jgi:hypothetical protein
MSVDKGCDDSENSYNSKHVADNSDIFRLVNINPANMSTTIKIIKIQKRVRVIYV